MIDEFTDVNGGEKELMKLWNIFSMENKSVKQCVCELLIYSRLHKLQDHCRQADSGGLPGVCQQERKAAEREGPGTQPHESPGQPLRLWPDYARHLEGEYGCSSSSCCCWGFIATCSQPILVQDWNGELPYDGFISLKTAQSIHWEKTKTQLAIIIIQPTRAWSCMLETQVR